jgi:hypothetical protein
MIQSVRASLAAKALSTAWAAVSPGVAAPSTGIALAFAWAISEGSFTSYYQGTNNFGSYHATSGFQQTHGSQSGYGMVAFLDHNPAAYITRMRVYPSLALGAQDFLTLVNKQVGGLASIQTAQAYATKTYVAGYYQGFATPVTPLAQRAAAAAAGTLTAADNQNIAGGVSLLNCYLPEAQAAVAAAASEAGDPTATSVGPFAPLASRLTPGSTLVNYAGASVPGTPHTLANARAVLGPNADDPPAGAISIADCNNAPGGQGVWMFGSGYVASSGRSRPVRAAAPSGASVLTAVLVGVAGAAAAAATTMAIERRVRG